MKRFWFLCALCCACLGAAACVPARADAVTDTLSVYVGYYGGPYYLKHTYRWSDLDDLYGGALDSHKEAYTYYSGSRAAVDSARGFYLSDFLQYADVDMNSIASLDFYTKDHTTGAYRTFTRYSLLDAPRYYFPNLAANETTGKPYARNGGSLWDGAQRVETMLALEDNWEWDADGSDYTAPSTSSRFRLLFGQLTPEESMTSAAAKYVYAIYVTFSGTPQLTAKAPDLSLKIGSNYQMTVGVSAEDSLLDSYVRKNIKWSSSDSSVIAVDSAGKLAVKKAGKAVVKASFGQSSVSVTVKVDGSGNVVSSGGAGGGTGSSGTGGGAGSGTSRTAGTSGISGGLGKRTGSQKTASEQADGNVLLLSGEVKKILANAKRSGSILTNNASSGSGSGGVANWRRSGMDKNAKALRVKINTQKMWPVYTAAGVLLCLGAGGSVLTFRSELREPKKKNHKGETI